MKFFKNPTFRLNKKDIYQIINLKNSEWNYGISSQLKWFNDKKNVFKNDLHFYLQARLLVLICKQIFVI